MKEHEKPKGSEDEGIRLAHSTIHRCPLELGNTNPELRPRQNSQIHLIVPKFTTSSQPIPPFDTNFHLTTPNSTERNWLIWDEPIPYKYHTTKRPTNKRGCWIAHKWNSQLNTPNQHLLAIRDIPPILNHTNYPHYRNTAHITMQPHWAQL